MAKKTASERIESAKQKYGLAEKATDGFLTRLVDSRWTLAIVVVACVAILAWKFW